MYGGLAAGSASFLHEGLEISPFSPQNRFTVDLDQEHDFSPAWM